jgi:AraC-like DNA-binding protein
MTTLLTRDVAIELILLAVAAGAMGAMATAMVRAERPIARWTGLAFSLGVVAFAFKLMNDALQGFPMWALVPVCTLAASTVGWFWMFMQSLFEDECRSSQRLQFAAVGVLTLTGLVGMYAAGPPQLIGWLACSAIQIAMALHALFIIVRGWKGDLVEARRNVRGPFLAVSAIYILGLRAMEIAQAFGAAPSWYEFVNAAVLAVVCVSGAFVFIDPRQDLFGRRPAVQPARAAAALPDADAPAPIEALDPAARAELDRLEKLMTGEEVWRSESLTVAGLALKVNVTEARLRRLINDHLGHRNFPSYVNAHRIAAACSRLTDAGEARTSVSAIAYDIGFGSLGPFNRAFRESTGKSPTEWRREALGAAMPPEPTRPMARVAAE